MSRNNCAIYVDANDRYCVRDKVLRVTDKGYSIHIANCGPLELLVYPTGDTDEMSTPSGITLQNGTNVLATPGVYAFPPFAVADGSVAPADKALHKAICCEAISDQTVSSMLIECLQNLKQIIGEPMDCDTEINTICGDTLVDCNGEPQTITNCY